MINTGSILKMRNKMGKPSLTLPLSRERTFLLKGGEKKVLPFMGRTKEGLHFLSPFQGETVTAGFSLRLFFIFVCFVSKLDNGMCTLQTQPKGCGYRVESNWLMFRSRRLQPALF
jgi:hypothetical protein